MSKACWSCHNQSLNYQAQCNACNALQPCNDIDSFERLELEKIFGIDPIELEKKYFEKQRLYHPDKFATRSKQERIYASQHSAALNEAFEELKDPLRRGRLLLKLAGHQTLNIEQQSLQDPELLFEVMTLREQLVEAQDNAALENMHQRLKSDIIICETSLLNAFNNEDLAEAAKQLNRLSYYKKISHEAQNRKVY